MKTDPLDCLKQASIWRRSGGLVNFAQSAEAGGNTFAQPSALWSAIPRAISPALRRYRNAQGSS
jgi:hypothetical protein